MVVTLGPGKFYGGDLPRPRFYADVKLNDHRVDPPLSVTDPLMEWAHDAHWSMGGVRFTRRRLQGRIEGNVDKLRAQRDNQIGSKSAKRKTSEMDKISIETMPVPVAIKRRRVVGLIDDDHDERIEKKLVKVGIRSSSRLAKKSG